MGGRQADSPREGNISKEFEDLCLKHGSSQGPNLALTVLCVPSLLDSGPSRTPVVMSETLNLEL